MKNVTIQRGLVCMTEDEFRRVMTELIALERDKALLEKQLQESTARVTLLEEHIRVTEAEAKRVSVEPIAQRESDS